MVVSLALNHRVVPSLFTNLRSVDAKLVPSDLLDALESYCLTLDAQAARLKRHLFELLDALCERGVDAVPFKGPMLGVLLSDVAGKRSPGDLDLLVRPQHVPAVRKLLEDLGYHDAGQGANAPALNDAQRRLYEHYQCEYQYARESDGMVVEPHWELCQRPLALDLDYLGMLDRARPVSVEGRSVLSLTPEDLLVALAVHGAKHQWQRLVWARDVAGLLTAFPSIDLGRVLDAAGRKGHRRVVLLSLNVARDLGGATLPPAASESVESDVNLVGLMDEIRGQLFDTEAVEPRNDRVEPFRLKFRERRLDRLKYTARTVFSPRRLHLEAAQLPAALSWAYYPLKVGIDYAVAPAWRALNRLKG